MSVVYRKRLKWYQQCTAITASTTPPADVAITEPGSTALGLTGGHVVAPGDSDGIHIPEHVGEDIACLVELTTAGGTPSMTVKVYGYLRNYTAQDGTLATIFGASGSLGRWVHVADLNGGTAIDTTNYAWAVPATNRLTWVENIRVGSQFERLRIHLWASGGTTPTLDGWFGWGGAE